MRKLLFFFMLVFWCSFVLLPEQESVEWLTPKEHDFGDLSRNVPVTHTFRFRNIGSDTLFIDNVRTACGCTAPTWPEAAVPPDSTAAVNVEYDARDEGYFRRYIKVYVSSQRRAEKLYITGYVE